MNVPLGDGKECSRLQRMEAGAARGAGIEVEHAVALLVDLAVAVPEDKDPCPSKVTGVRQLVHDAHRNAAERDIEHIR